MTEQQDKSSSMIPQFCFPGLMCCITNKFGQGIQSQTQNTIEHFTTDQMHSMYNLHKNTQRLISNVTGKGAKSSTPFVSLHFRKKIMAGQPSPRQTYPPQEIRVSEGLIQDSGTPTVNRPLLNISPWKLPLQIGEHDSISIKWCVQPKFPSMRYRTGATKQINTGPFLQNQIRQLFGNFFSWYKGSKIYMQTVVPLFCYRIKAPIATHHQVHPCLTLPEQRCRMDTRFCKDVYFHLSCSALDSIKKTFA